MNGAKGIIDASHNEGIAVADNRPVPMPPHIKAELERLRALMAPDAEAYHTHYLCVRKCTLDVQFAPFEDTRIKLISLD